MEEKELTRKGHERTLYGVGTILYLELVVFK